MRKSFVRAAATVGMMLAFSMTAWANDADAVAVYQAAQAKAAAMTDVDACYNTASTMNVDGMNVSVYQEMQLKGTQMQTPAAMKASFSCKTMVSAAGALGQGAAGGDSFNQNVTMNWNMYFGDGMAYIDLMGQKMKTPMVLSEAQGIMSEETGFAQVDLAAMQDMKLRVENGNFVVSYSLTAQALQQMQERMSTTSGMQRLQAMGADIRYYGVQGECTINPEGYCVSENMYVAGDAVMPDGKVSNFAVNTNVLYINPGQPVSIQAPNPAGYELIQ